MPLSHLVSAEIQTIEILSTANVFTYEFRIPQNSVAQILWINLSFSTSVIPGVRRLALNLSDAASNTVYEVRYFRTQTASTVVPTLFLQGSTIIPASVIGLNTTIPFDGLFAGANYTLRIFDIFGITAFDSFAGYMQTRGLHNSGAQ